MALRRHDRHPQAQCLNRASDEGGHQSAGDPLVIGRNHPPRRPLRARVPQRTLEGVLIGVPVRSFVDVSLGELPVLCRVRESREKATSLLRLRHVKEELEDNRAIAHEMPLEGIDIVVSCFPEPSGSRPGGKLLLLQDLRVDANNENVLVVGPVEDPYAAALRKRLRVPPEKRVVEFLGRGLLERVDLAPLRVDAAHDVLDRAVLAGAVHGLEYDEHGMRVVRPQYFLRASQRGEVRLQVGLRSGFELVLPQLSELVPRRPRRIEVRKAQALSTRWHLEKSIDVLVGQCHDPWRSKTVAATTAKAPGAAVSAKDAPATKSGNCRPSAVITWRRHHQHGRCSRVTRGIWLALRRIMLVPVRSVWVALYSLWVVLAFVLLCAAAFAGVTTAATAVFHHDDPLAREPESQDASGVQEWTIDLFIDLAVNLFGQPGDSTTGVRAANVNTIDEVPDSSWFTNRILARPLSIDEAVRGPRAGSGPAPGLWTIVGSKDAGVAPGFRMTDAAGETWFVSFDARGYPDAATGAIMVANSIFWALGYWQADNVLVRVRPEDIRIDDRATVTPMSGVARRMRREDLDAIWRRAHRSPDGSFRGVAARRLPGKPLGGFRYHGTRPDDPNDIVPHEHRRELRALKVFGAWTNLVDMKAGNTLDVLVSDGGRSVVRHYLQDVGSTFGTGALAPREFDEGWEHVHEGNLVWKRLVLLGFPIAPWHTVHYAESPEIGRFEGAAFDPEAWKPRVPTAAFRHAQPDDLFWAARRVTAFSDGMIRALVKTAQYGSPDAETHLADVLIQRRDRIGAAYLTAVTPLVDFALTADGRLSFHNAAVDAKVATEPRGGYRVTWARFDNASGTIMPLTESSLTSAGAVRPTVPLPDQPDTFVAVTVSPIDPPYRTWVPVRTYFRRVAGGWALVGLDRSVR